MDIYLELKVRCDPGFGHLRSLLYFVEGNTSEVQHRAFCLL